jgi:hypothetical protein
MRGGGGVVRLGSSASVSWMCCVDHMKTRKDWKLVSIASMIKLSDRCCRPTWDNHQPQFVPPRSDVRA